MKRDINILRIYGFVLFMGVGTFFPFIFLYIRELGFSNVQIGFFAAIGPAVMMLIQPFWGWVSDLTGRPERVLIYLSLGIAGSVALLAVGRSFMSIVIYMILFNLFYSSQTPTYDSIVFRTIAKSDVSYGQIRWLGSLGFALTTYGVGKVIEITHISVALWNYVVIALLLAFLSIRLPSAVKENIIRKNTQERVKIWPLLKNREFVIFLLASAFVVGSNAINNTFFPFLFKELGGGESLLGLAMMIAAIAEIPFFFFSAKLIWRYRIPNLLLIAFGVTILRWFLNSIAISPYQLLAYQLLHSLTFGLFYSSAVVYVDRLTPSRLRTSGQSLFWATTFGFGNVVANLVGGWIYQYYSVQTLYVVASVAAALGTLILAVGIFSRNDLYGK